MRHELPDELLFEMTAIPGNLLQIQVAFASSSTPTWGISWTSLCRFYAIFLKILAKGTLEALAKIFKIYASFLVPCLVVSCWLFIKTNLHQRLWRKKFQDISLRVLRIFLKVFVKGTPEAMAKSLEIYALFLVPCL